MKGIIVFSSSGSVVFHTAPYSREVVDHVVAVVESDIHVKSTFDGSNVTAPAALGEGGAAVGSAFVSSPLRTASAHRHGASATHAAVGKWLEVNHKRVCEGFIPLCGSEHPWLQEPEDGLVLLFWRKVSDKVIVFALEGSVNMSLAKHSMSVLLLLLSDAFRCRGELPSLKDIVGKPEVMQACCSCIAPQHVLALVDVQAAKLCLSKLLRKK